MVMFLILKKLCNKALEKKWFSQTFFLSNKNIKAPEESFSQFGL